MGWSSGQRIFDPMVKQILTLNSKTAKALIETLLIALEDADWDTQDDSRYYDHPIVRAVLKKIHPDWDFDS